VWVRACMCVCVISKEVCKQSVEMCWMCFSSMQCAGRVLAEYCVEICRVCSGHIQCGEGGGWQFTEWRINIWITQKQNTRLNISLTWACFVLQSWL
jgi:hypothetical protein